MKKYLYIMIIAVLFFSFLCGVVGFLHHFIITYGLRQNFYEKTGYPPSILTVESIAEGSIGFLIGIIISLFFIMITRK